ncbi:DUF1707 SHOCT-like domain-containing protein [Tenggerimyces flavus]|uniref:DUF1707 domain-containing protein n=1 Tax=Tenggerimyces flavus TaxID=1708749 RepID=A0ABV7YBK6_9ACTN|nr:DUF1707 domain-containing protein [Tenggerimyces flavus]MBM7787205.1 hypothetical protein [Tenggerimyces flavus]
MISDWTSRPHVRARDVDRDYAMGVLRDASVAGQLRPEEFDHRLRKAMEADTLGELAGLVVDLQAPRVPPPPLPPPRPVPVAPESVPSRQRRSLTPVAGIVLAGVVVGMVAVLFTGVLDRAPSMSVDDSAGAEPVDNSCFDNPSLTSQCLVDNAAAQGGLSTLYQRDLGLPTSLPIPNLAEFEGGTTLSASMDKSKTTYRWHLAYSVPNVDAFSVADLYRYMVKQDDFGINYDESSPNVGVTELTWDDANEPPEQGQPASQYTLTMRATDSPDGARVELDVARTTDGTVARPDVAGAYADEVKKVKTETVDGMKYVGSTVSQQTDPATCVLWQEWEADAGQYQRIQAAAQDLGAELTKAGEVFRLRFKATKNDCKLPGV